VDFREFVVRYFNTLRIDVGVQLCLDAQTFAGRRIGNEADHRVQCHKWLTTPILCDVAKHAVFDFIPFARAGREMTYADFQPSFICQSLKRHFPASYPVAVAPAAIGSYE
jgi:hypothetical protein